LGFKEIKDTVIKCIRSGFVQHEERDSDKNLYATGDLSSAEVIKIIEYCRGDWYQKSRHHFLDIDVHVLKPKGKYDGYYIKFYFIEPDAWFISVHR
jgi:hypothetical protein